MIEKFFIGFLFLSFSAWSQVVTYDTIVEIKENQTGVYDTIVYIKKHVEVKVEVLVRISVYPCQCFRSHGCH